MLRPATFSDIPLIRELAHRIWWAYYPGIITDEQIAYMLDLVYNERALGQQMTEEGQQFWLAEANGMAIGYLSVSRQEEGVYFLHKFYLDTAFRGKGLGTLAFHALQDQYPDLQELRLTVNRQNFNSVNFYFKVGFVIEKCMDTPIGRGFIMDDFQMLWRRPKK
ncbi:MAG: GNAT family N-acetyltransferase [Thermoanaerobaculia bacterium]|nr:GNAT family N-acetyltransferase [Thermoanaerobaculia bacterium]